jgi:hypothetical protein
MYYFVDSWTNNAYNKIQFRLMNTTLFSIVEMNNYNDNNCILQNITILGVVREPLNATINEYPFNHYFYNKTEKVI